MFHSHRRESFHVPTGPGTLLAMLRHYDRRVQNTAVAAMKERVQKIGWSGGVPPP
jgi:hypothetical protein